MADIADLALLLFLPWFLIIAALYWFYPRLMEKTPARRRFDLALLLLAVSQGVSQPFCMCIKLEH